MDIVEAATLVLSGSLFGKEATPESVNTVREVLANADALITQVTKRFDDHLKSARMDGKKVINRDYLKGVSFFRNPQGWEDDVKSDDVLAGLSQMFGQKVAGK